MFRRKQEDNEIIKKPEIERGRVVDLKKISQDQGEGLAKESFNSTDMRETNKSINFSKRGKAFFDFKKKDKQIDLLKKYEVEDDSFNEELILSEFIKEEPRKNLLKLFLEKAKKLFSFWWLPLFLVRFVFLFVYQLLLLIIFRKRNWNKKMKVVELDDDDPALAESPSKVRERILKKSYKIEIKSKIEQKKTEKIPKIAKKEPGLFFRKLKNFILGKEEDRLYQQALFEEVIEKKFSPAKHFLTFVVLAVLLILPFKVLSDRSLIDFDGLRGRVLGISERAINSLKQAASSASNFELDKASYDFFLARDSFKEAREDLEEINGILFSLAKFFPNDEIRLAGESKHILAAGEIGSNLGRNLTLAFNSFGSKAENEKISETIDNFIEYMNGAKSDAIDLKEELGKINESSLPLEYQENFILVKEKVGQLENILDQVCDATEKINLFLGKEEDKRYLFVFQNNNEMRATGGFIGSFALVDFKEGGIKNIEIPGGGSYDTEAGLKKLVASPEPLYLVDPLWHFWDANWWPDWEKSAKKLMWFYEKSGGPSTDGVISLTPTVLEKLLRITGEIDMTETHGVVMNADNFWVNTRDIIEKEKKESKLSYEEAEKKPKKIIGELLKRILEILPEKLDRQSLKELLIALEQSLDEKHILFYFKDQELQQEAVKRNWAGKIKETSKDYLAVINTNIAGGKSDKRMREIITHEVEIMPDGTIIDNVTIERIHTGSIEESYYGVRNVNWMRIYVPKGSELLHASGFRGPNPIYFEYPEDDWEKDIDLFEEEENFVIDRNNLNTKIYNEDDKTVFANWSMVDPGNSAIIRLRYKLPFKFEKKQTEEEEDEGKIKEIFNKFFKVEQKDLFVYSLLIQKQAGSRFTTIQTKFDLPDGFKSLWNYPKDLKLNDNGWSFKEELDTDKYWALILEKNDEE